jgi:signal transduction histidine kinase
MVTQFVMPILTLATILFYIAHWTNDPWKKAMTLFGLLVAGANIWATSQDRVFRVGPHTFRTQSDAAAFLRWVLNLATFDALLMIVFRPRAEVFVCSWLLLVAAAQADTFRQRYRHLVVAIGMGIGGVLLVALYPALSVLELALILAYTTGILVMLGMTETYWLRESATRLAAQKRELDSKWEAERVKRDAAVGSQMRMVSHELGNLLTILDIASSANDHAISGRQLDMVRRAVDYGKRINALILQDARAPGAERTLTVATLLADVELLLAKEVRNSGIHWSAAVTPHHADLAFVERSGSSYFILHNLVKNAKEAHFSKQSAPQFLGAQVTLPDAMIRLSVQERAGCLLIGVEDNAGTLDDATRHALLEGVGQTSKRDGHGLGLRFVREECHKNGYELEIEVESGTRTHFCIVIPPSRRQFLPPKA